MMKVEDFLSSVVKYIKEEQRHYENDFLILPNFMFEALEEHYKVKFNSVIPLNDKCLKMFNQGFDCIPLKGIPVILESDAFRWIHEKMFPKPKVKDIWGLM